MSGTILTGRIPPEHLELFVIFGQDEDWVNFVDLYHPLSQERPRQSSSIHEEDYSERF